MSRKSQVLWVLSFLVSAVACVVFAVSSASNAGGRKHVIGVILSVSGPADFIGRPEKQVLEAFWSDLVSTRPGLADLQLIIRDSGGRIDQAKVIYDNFASNPSTIAIIGPSTSGESIEIAKLAERDGIPLLSLAASRDIVVDSLGGAERTRRWVFKFAQNDDLAAKRLLRAIANKGGAKVALLSSNDGFGKSGAAQFAKAAAESASGIQIVHASIFQASKLDTPEIVVAAVPATADSLVIWGTAPGPSLLVKAARSAGLRQQIYLSHGDASDLFIKSTGLAAEKSIIIGSRVLLKKQDLDPNNDSDKVILQYQAFWSSRFSGTPSHFGGHARDALHAFLRAYEAERSPSRNSVRDHLERDGELVGVTGTFRFSSEDHAGLDEGAFEVYEVRNGSFARSGL
jgi:branched-chain amino acid transport system substrate-binding protein